jgi:Na+/proline symporter
MTALVSLAVGVFGAAFIMFICGWISWKNPADERRFFGGLVVGLILSGLWFSYWFSYWFVRVAFG